MAESCQRMLVDSKVIEKLAKKDKGLFNKLKQFITDFFNKIIARYKKLTPTSAEARLVQEIEGMSEKLQSLFEDALLDAAENHRIVGTQKNTAQGDVKMQLREMGLDEFSKQTKNNIKMRNGVLVENMSELKQHIQLALTTDSKSNLYFGAITDDVKNKIENDVKSRVFQDKQYSFVVSYDDIIHISKHFGTEPDVVAQEVLRLYDIVKNYDDVKLEITKHGTKKLIFEKSYSDYGYRSIEIASNKKATLDLVSFYITKNNIKRKGNQSVPPATQNSSSQWGSVSSKNSIPNETESVNTKFQLKAKDSAYEEAMQEYQQTHSIESVKKMVALVDEFAERAMPDSKVRDKKGKLMKVYHGTEADDFNVFDKARRGQTDSSLWGRGYYFSSDYEFAEMFGDNVRSFFLNITNPFTISKVDAPASEIADKLIALGEKINFDYSKLKALEFAKAFGNQKFTDVLMSHGFDGVFVGDVNDECIEYATFDRNQMKLSDPITYDDSGKVIPLSERFDDSKVDIRFQKKAVATEVTPKITLNMGEQERYEILKNREITIAVADSDKIPSDNGLTIKNLKKTDAKKLIKTIAKEFNVFGSYENTDIEISFEFGSNNLDESINKQKSNYDLFMQMLSCFSDVISNAIGIEVHNRNSEGYKIDRTLKQVYVMCSAFANDEYIVPVKLSVKEFVDKPNRLYVAVALEGIKKDRVVNMGVPENGSHVHISPVTISIAEIFKNVNEKDVDFIKYIPRQFFEGDNNKNSNSNELETKNGLPEGVLKYQYKAYAVETDTELLAQHLEENSELVSEVLRRSAKIEMKDGTMRRLVDRRLRYYGIGRELRKETAEYISAIYR